MEHLSRLYRAITFSYIRKYLSPFEDHSYNHEVLAKYHHDAYLLILRYLPLDTESDKLTCVRLTVYISFKAGEYFFT